MNRNFTNAIRFLMDECVPPIIRDSKWFMYPFFYFAYRGKNIRETMEFKSRVVNFTEKEYADFYNSINSISRNRSTDLNRECINYILENVDSGSSTLVDIGCANGYLLNLIHQQRKDIKLHGFDIKKFDLPGFVEQSIGDIHHLPYEDKQFDTVICCHTIEHLTGLPQCINELIRIARKEVIIVTPCQKPFYYTLDEHVNFFYYKEQLTSIIPLDKYSCEKLKGDWVYHGYIK
jgi:ubiquinone/menaquinone biosynthesis C-methylase UbiE